MNYILFFYGIEIAELVRTLQCDFGIMAFLLCGK
tara:strand:- start:49 stop:150 length:102 start_codon:yes stop_codon:yes gene_type:complete